MKKLLICLLLFGSTLFAEKATDAFSFLLTKQVFEENRGTIFISPYSAQVTLQMAKMGAQHKTHEEMQNVLGPPFLLPNSNNFSSYQAICIDRSFTPLQLYISAIWQKFRANLFRIDFSNEQKKLSSLQTINGLVKKKTDGQISDLLLPQDVDSSTKLILLNASLFKSNWLSPFLQENTQKAPFTTCDGDQVEVDMMKQSDFFHVVSDSEVTILALDFKRQEQGHEQVHQPEYYSLFILPKESDKLSSVEQKITKASLEEWQKLSKSEYVELYLPKVKIEYRQDLKTALQNLGMKEAFTDLADFSKIAAQNDLFINKVIQKTCLTIDENGLEAAAATAASFNMKAFLPPKEKITLRFDRPFLLLILEKKSSSLIFAGRICKP